MFPVEIHDLTPVHYPKQCVDYTPRKRDPNTHPTPTVFPAQAGTQRKTEHAVPSPSRPPSFPRRREPRTRGKMGAGHHSPSAKICVIRGSDKKAHPRPIFLYPNSSPIPKIPSIPTIPVHTNTHLTRTSHLYYHKPCTNFGPGSTDLGTYQVERRREESGPIR